MRDAIGISPPVFSWLGRLLFLEVCLLAAIAGILAWRWTGPGLLLFSLILLLDLPRARSFVPARGYVFPLLIASAIGFVYTGLREPFASALPPAPPPVTPAFQEAGAVSRRVRYLQMRGKADDGRRRT